MKFTDIYEFIKYLNDNNLKIDETVDIQINPLDKIKYKKELSRTLEACFPQFQDSPKLKISLNESIEDDILLVDSYEALPNLCGVGKIKWYDRDIITNICERDGKAYVYFDTKINEFMIPEKKYLLLEKSSATQYNDSDIILTEETFESWHNDPHS